MAEAASTSDDATGWFDQLYREAGRGETVVPWSDQAPNPHLVDWARDHPIAGAGRRALVVGCGFGDDAEFVAGLGFDVVAFDLSPAAIEAARARYPGSPVDYRVADLLRTPPDWVGAFDLVVEIYTIQPLFGAVRAGAIAALPRLVAPGGTLLVIARATEEDDPVRDPAQMPWALTRAEVDALDGGRLRPDRVELFLDDADPPRLRWLAEFHG